MLRYMLFCLLYGTENVKFCNGSMPHFPHDSEILKKQVQSTDRKRERQDVYKRQLWG